MTSKPEPDKLGRNMKALPANCQKLADGIQQSWNRAIPENDYIQLGTLRYGVRLSNTGLLEGAKGGPGDPAEGNARGSINSYEIANGGSSVHSVGGTSSVSSAEQQNCCCIGTSGVEMPWANSFSRTKLPVPSSLAKNRKSSPTASTATTTVGGAGGASPVGVGQQQQQQQQHPRYPSLASGRTSNSSSNGHGLSQSTLSHGHGSDDDTSGRGTVSGLGGYTNGSANKTIITGNSKSNHLSNNNNNNNNHHHNNNNNSNSYQNSNTGVNGRKNQEVRDRAVVGDQEQQQHETSPRCSTVVCCYSNSFSAGSSRSSSSGGSSHQKQNNAQQQQQLQQKEPSPERAGIAGRNSRHRQQRRDRTIEFPTRAASYGEEQLVGTGGRHEARNGRPEWCPVRGGERGSYEQPNDAELDDDISALVVHAAGCGCESSGSGYHRHDGGDLNLNSRNAQRQQQPQQQQQQQQQPHQVAQQRWQQQQQQQTHGGKDVNINNFEKKKISSDPRGGGQSAANAASPAAARPSVGGSGERSSAPQRQPSLTGSDICADEPSPTASVSPARSASPAVHQQAWCVPGSVDPSAATLSPLAQPHPPQIATPFGQRRRVLQPPSSLPVVRSYSFHRVAPDSGGPRSPTVTPRSPGLHGTTGTITSTTGQLFDPAAADFAGRNRSFRNAHHSRRLQYGGYGGDEPIGGLEKPNGLAHGGPGDGLATQYCSVQHPHVVTRKSSLPVLSSNGGYGAVAAAAGPAGRYPHHHHPLSGSRSSIDECYPFDKSTCQPECILTPRSHRKLPCSDAINEIRLQSLNKYCNQLLGATTSATSVPYRSGSVPLAVADRPTSGGGGAIRTTLVTGTHDPHAHPIDELEDLSFIDSSDLSSTGDDITISDRTAVTRHNNNINDSNENEYQEHAARIGTRRSLGRECRAQHKHHHRPSIITSAAVNEIVAAADAIAACGHGGGGGGSLPAAEAAVDSGKTLAQFTSVYVVGSRGGDGGSATAASATVITIPDGGANRNNYIDSSSDELSSVCSGVEQLTLACSGAPDGAEPRRRNGHHQQQQQQQQPVVVKYRVQCDRNDSNASDEHPATRYGGPRLLGADGDEQHPVAGVTTPDRSTRSSVVGNGSDRSSGSHAGVVSFRRHSDSNNSNRRNNGDGDCERHQRQQHPPPQQQQQQQQQKNTTLPANNSAVKSVSVGGVGGVGGPGRPGGVGEQQTLPGRAATDDSCGLSPSSSSSLPSSYAAGSKLLLVGYASSSPDSSPAHHAGLNCFGRSATQQLHAAGGSTADKSIMEKRNNTLDRLQRLVKKTTSGSVEKQTGSGGPGGPPAASNAGAGGSKTERLRELTELLKGNRAPPVPPPRRAKHAHSVDRTMLDRHGATALSTTSLINIDAALLGSERDIESQLLKATKESRSVDIPYRFADSAGQRMSTPSSPLAEHKSVNLRANVSTSNLEGLHHERRQAGKANVGEECKSETALKDDDELFAKLSRPESRTIVGSYTQKTIPFRSASFSQVDYSSGKYIRSALGALKNTLMKGKEQSSVDSNTIPRQGGSKVEVARSCSPTELYGSQSMIAPQADDTDVAKLTIKKTELNINLAPLDDYGRFFDERMERLEGKADLASNRNSDIETIVEDPVAEHIESVENATPVPPLQASISVMEASEMVLESPVEEGIPITPSSLSKDDECLQQATTCLIPVPVYDCVVSEWSTARPSEQWIDASMTEYGKYSDALDSIKEVNESAINDPPAAPPPEAMEELSENFHPEQIVVEQPPQVIEPQVSIELSEDGGGSEGADLHDESGAGSDASAMLCTPPVSIICTEPESNEFTTIVDGTATHKVSVVLGDGSEVEVVEVRKRHSNNEDTGDPQHCRLSNDVDEKRRLESRKSRRKGIYIQWPAIDGNSELESDNNESGTPAAGEGEGGVSWNPDSLGHVTEKDSSLDLSGESFTDLSVKEPTDREHAVHSPDRYLLDPTTPDSDPGKPIWPKGVGRRQSLTYQSSDEKDDTVPVPPPQVRSLKTLFLRSDSVSDNESDRASSRDRTSASPAPGGGDPDLKRYSKRPLRGPYGQMLEAEMKKPTTKVQYNEILEELTRNEGHGAMPGMGRHRAAGSQSMDETNDRHTGKACKPRKTSANLPVPTHVRTSSSPSKLSDSSGSHSASPSKRFLGNIEQRSTDSEKSDKSGGVPAAAAAAAAAAASAAKLESKKLSLDSHLPDRSVKRGGSDGHEKPSKRSVSSASDKQQKRSLDEVRLSQNSRTPSERSFTLNTPNDGPKGGLTASPELLAELLKGSSEKLITEQLTGGGGNGGPNASAALPSAVLNCLDTRTHVVVELFDTEKSYVDSLQTIVLKYLNQLKSPENAGLVDVQTVDEIFFMVPAILNIHERFLEELRRRLDSWDKMQMIGDAFVDVFSRPVILDTYTSFVNNWNRAKDAIRSARQKCPAFARFLEAMAREHKGKLSLDNLLIKPVQKFPNYELIFTRLIKNTDVAHPDQKPLQEALKLVHDILIFLNCKEKEALENGQRETALRELEGVIEGMNDLVAPERAFLLFDLVSMPSGQVTRKERGFFLFNDLLVITSIKRRSGTIRKTNMTCPGSVASTLDTNKYKYLTKISLDDLEIVKSKDENVRRIMKEIEHLTEDSGKLIQISDLTASLRCPHASLEEAIRELQRDIQRQLAERQTNDAQLNVLELTWNTSGIQNMTVVFSKPEKRTQWEEFFAEAKQKLANSLERSQIPEFFVSVPIRKTRAGLQFTCASPTLGSQRDVWVCNSDGYVGQVCVLSLVPEPSVTSCNGVCNARILCVSSVPASDERPTSSALMNVNISIVDASSGAGGVASGKPSGNSAVNSPSKGATERKGSFKTAGDGGGGRPVHNEPNVQLDSGSSSEDSEAESQPERGAPSPSGASLLGSNHHRQQDSTASGAGDESVENQQSTMWLGTEDGCIHVYNCTDNIRIKKNKIKIPHVSAVYSILYLDNRVFVSLANGDICVYSRDRNGWNVTAPLTVTVGTVSNPVVKLLNVHGKLWCAIQGTIKVLNTKSLQIDSQIQISNDSKPITNMTVLNDYVWISVQNSAHIKCCHHESFEVIFEVNLALSVNKMLSNCDDIIRQHKAACLRVTSLLACKDLIWVGTSAGVLLTIAAHSVAKGSSLPIVTGIPHGHTGHVRFLTYVESPDAEDTERDGPSTAGQSQAGGKSKPGNSASQELLVISGGDGYEDFRSAGNNTMSEVAGREDSTNHLLLWKV